MENATKALMIAGAVLIAIMIIGVGMMIFTSGSNTVKENIAKLDQMEIKMFNSEFEGYEGKRNGSMVKEMISTVIALNASNRDVHDEKLVKVSLTPKTGTPTSDKDDDAGLADIRKAIVNGKTYDVSFGYTSGLITSITIAEQ